MILQSFFSSKAEHFTLHIPTHKTFKITINFVKGVHQIVGKFIIPMKIRRRDFTLINGVLWFGDINTSAKVQRGSRDGYENQSLQNPLTLQPFAGFWLKINNALFDT